MSAATSNQRYLIVIIGSLIALLYLCAGVLGMKPSFKAGYFTPQDPVVKKDSGITLSEERRLELESLLLPPPILAWADEAHDDDLPSGLASGATLLAFSNKGVEADLSVKPAPSKGRVVTSQLNIPEAPVAPKTEDAPLIPVPEISDDGIDLNTGDNLKIKPVYLERLPELKSLTVVQRKKRFTAVLLPLILRANIELNERRELIVQDAANGDVKKLRQWAELYRVKTDSTDVEELRESLLLRVDQVPVSLALAQSAIESGWGTSRFAVQGNALFGQWAWSNDLGLKPTDSRYENAVVRSFSNLFDSVRAYMHNLNTHHSYENFRRLRQRKGVNTNTLAGALVSYSEEGDVYVEKLRSMIEVNDFTLYDNAKFLSE